MTLIFLSSAVGNKDNDGESQHVDADESVPERQRERPFVLASVMGKLESDKDRKLGKYITLSDTVSVYSFSVYSDGNRFSLMP